MPWSKKSFVARPKDPAGRPPSGRAGLAPAGAFTIAEVMIAATVMAFAITTSITTMQRAFLALDTSRNLTLAGQIMVSEMETARMLPWTTVSDSTLFPSGPVTIDSSFTNNARIGNRFTLTRTVTTPVANPDIREITLSISWRGYDGRLLERSYFTCYARNGIHDYLYNTV